MTDYSYPSYGANGPADGGGFLAESGSQNPNSARREYGADTLRPLTIRQINTAVQPHPDADFIIDNASIKNFTFVGRIRSSRSQPTNHLFTLDDGTGEVEVKLWIDPEVMQIDTEGDNSGGRGAEKNLKEGVYARVFGKIDQYGNKRHVGARAVRAVSDYNEVQVHLLEAAVVHLQMTRGPPGGQKNVNGVSEGGMQGVEMNGGGMGYGARQLPSGLSNASRRVYHCLSTSNQTNEGLHMQDIAGRLSMDMSEVAKAGDELMNNGLVYTTVDEQTWAILDDL
ncbi:MAG: hypothetical protein Q9162_007031 [Coniocarpon cinnabarinum]